MLTMTIFPHDVKIIVQQRNAHALERGLSSRLVPQLKTLTKLHLANNNETSLTETPLILAIIPCDVKYF